MSNQQAEEKLSRSTTSSVLNYNSSRPTTSQFVSRGRKFIENNQGTLIQRIKEKNYRRDCTPITPCKHTKPSKSDKAMSDKH